MGAFPLVSPIGFEPTACGLGSGISPCFYSERYHTFPRSITLHNTVPTGLLTY